LPGRKNQQAYDEDRKTRKRTGYQLHGKPVITSRQEKAIESWRAFPGVHLCAFALKASWIIRISRFGFQIFFWKKKKSTSAFTPVAAIADSRKFFAKSCHRTTQKRKKNP
jgi:hypothetical protein